MEITLSHVAQRELNPPLYFPEGSRICGVEIMFSGGEWQILYYAVTPVNFKDVQDFYKSKYDARLTKWTPMQQPRGKPARFHFLVWKDRLRRQPLFSVLVMQYNEFAEDAKRFSLTREEEQMTQIVAGIAMPDLCQAAHREKSVSWVLPIPRTS